MTKGGAPYFSDKENVMTCDEIIKFKKDFKISSNANRIIFSKDLNNGLYNVEYLAMQSGIGKEIMQNITEGLLYFRSSSRFPMSAGELVESFKPFFSSESGSSKGIEDLIKAGYVKTEPQLPFLGVAGYFNDVLTRVYTSTISTDLINYAKRILSKESFNTFTNYIEERDYTNIFGKNANKYSELVTSLSEEIINNVPFTALEDRILHIDTETRNTNVYVGDSLWKVFNRYSR